MSIDIGGYRFDGPHGAVTALDDRGGVYAILTRLQDGSYSLLDIGESATVHTRVATHDRAPCWQRNKANGVFVAVFYTPNLQGAGRRVIEHELRRRYNPPCGDR